MKCKNCGAELPNDVNFCTSCGAKVESIHVEPTPTPTPEPPKEKKKTPVWVWILIVVLIVALAVMITLFAVKGNDKEEEVVPSTTISTTIQETTIAATSEASDAKYHRMNYPASNQYLSSYRTARANSHKLIDGKDWSDGHEYIKLRVGPGRASGKTNYDKVLNSSGDELQIPNGEYLTVKSVDVNGRTFVEWNGYEGWARTGFLEMY